MFTKKTPLALAIVAIFTLSSCSSEAPGKNVAPIVSVSSPDSIAEGTSVELTVVGEDPDGTIRQISWSRTYGPPIDFNDTDRLRTVAFIAPEVEVDTPLGLLVEVVDDDGAVAQVFMEILITNTLQLLNISSKITHDYFDNSNVEITLEFDQEPLLDSFVDYSESCNGGVTFSNNDFKSCLSYTLKTDILNVESSVLQLESLQDITRPIQMKISKQLVNLNNTPTLPMFFENILDESKITEALSILSK